METTGIDHKARGHSVRKIEIMGSVIFARNKSCIITSIDCHIDIAARILGDLSTSAARADILPTTSINYGRSGTSAGSNRLHAFIVNYKARGTAARQAEIVAKFIRTGNNGYVISSFHCHIDIAAGVLGDLCTFSAGRNDLYATGIDRA